MAWKVSIDESGRYIVHDDENWYVASCQNKRRAQLIASAPQAPQMLEALETIAKGAIVSPEQPPEKIAEQVLRVLRLAREDCVKSLEFIGVQQQRAERAEEALCDIRDAAGCYMQPLPPGVARTRWERIRDRAITAIAATKGKG